MAKKKELQEIKASLFETRSRLAKRRESTTDPEKLKKLEQQWADINARIEALDEDEWALIKELTGNVEDDTDEANEILDEAADPVDIDEADEANEILDEAADPIDIDDDIDEAEDEISEPEPAPKPEPKKQPTPVHMPNPAAKAAPAPKAAPPATPAQPVKAAEPVAKGPRTLRPDGPGKIYKYWNHETSTWGFCPNKAAARQLSNVYQKVYVWYKDGEPDHIMNEEEIAKYLPR